MRVLRPDIQALRALAVALVVVFHVWPAAVPGGYVGVDVFFVISGYLITSHLVRELDATGSVDLRAFWARRIRRLLPAASVVLLFCFVMMVTVIPPSLGARTASEIAASAFSIENWVLAANSVDYLGAEGSATIVQHYWSLSVEEQFYVVWPILLLAVGVFAGGRRRVLLAVMAVVAIASLVLSIGTTGDPAAYFNSAGRAWEFAAGGLLALVPWTLPRALSFVGYGLIAVSAFAFTAATPFPGAFALIPVVGTVLVIGAATATRIEKLAPVQFIGGLSYGIYLWHWPLVVVASYLPVGGLGPIVVVASIALAWLSRRYVEGRAVRRPYLVAAGVAVSLLVATTVTTSVAPTHAAPKAGSCVGAAALVNGCDDPFAVTSSIDTAAAAIDKGSLGMDCSSPDTAVVQCEFGDLSDPVHTVALVGNSHAGHLVGALETVPGWKVILMRKTGCTGALAVAVAQPTDPACLEWTGNVLDRIRSDPSIDVVVYATNNDSLHYLGPKGADEAELVGAIEDTLAGLVADGKTVVAFGDVPGHYEQPAPECVFVHRFEDDPCSTALTDEHDNFVAQAARATAGVTFEPLTPYFCDTRCHVVIGGEVVYIDEHHLTASYSRSLGPYLGAVLEAAVRDAAAAP